MHVPTGAHHSPRDVWGQETGWSHLWNWMKKETEVEQPAPAWVPTAHRLEGWASMRYVRDIFPDGDLWSWGDSSAKKLEIYRRDFCQRSFREHVARGRDSECSVWASVWREREGRTSASAPKHVPPNIQELVSGHLDGEHQQPDWNSINQ